ncbi:GntR family transcriptional regulator (plasmid) [Martelella lutilitoris]|uniref:GntR family transcriptional regulator n=1 Tax=Martelella lutilitoris TaxID=2583532 RepID=A0A7T7HQ26_9HYPH|nr:GntR family transcriptional regulator [Martelella lutilitoris]QQM33118.1 GntR family transcriptional regulator [Martelella lutilitoris]QRX65268.1 GntR family transcriptional regulator [Dysgonomonadaceae bacterium zrk40]
MTQLAATETIPALRESWREWFDPKQPIVTQLYRYLRSEILTLSIAPKVRLSEKDLSDRLGLSRTPVREALIRLAEEGLVDILPQRGTFVSPIRINQVKEAQFIREALETAIARRAAETVTDELMIQLDRLIAQQEAAIGVSDLDGFLKYDEAFHETLCEHCSLNRTWKMLQHVKGQLDRVRYLSLPNNRLHVDDLFNQHKVITEAIRARDAQSASAAMAQHLSEVYSTIERLIRSKPEIFDLSEAQA